MLIKDHLYKFNSKYLLISKFSDLLFCFSFCYNFLIACFYVSAGKSSTLEYATRVTPKYGFETKNSTSISPEAYRLHAIPNQFFKNLGAPLGSSI